MIEGAYRLACALYFKQELIPVKINRFTYDTPYGIDWFKEHNFTDDETEIIEKKRKEIFYNSSAYFQIILWPPVQDYFDEIELDLIFF